MEEKSQSFSDDLLNFWSKEKISKVKKKIRNLLWMYCHDDTTLSEMDDRSIEIMNIIAKLPEEMREQSYETISNG